MATLLDAINITLNLGNTRILKERFGFQLDKDPIPSCIQKYSFGSQGYWECYARTTTGPENHQAGSCRMGPSTDPMAVVDPELNVYGVKNLRIMDASIMPVVVSGNTNAPVMMIAEKGSDIIKKRWLPADISGRFGADDEEENVDVTSKFSGNNPSYSRRHNHGGYPDWGGFGSNHWRGGFGSNQGYSNSGYEGHQGHARARAYHQNQGFNSAGTYGSNQRHADNVPEGGYDSEANSNTGHHANSVRADPRYQTTATYNSGTEGYDFVPYKTGRSNVGQYHSSDRCRHVSGGTYHKNDCYNGSNGGNAFYFRRNSTPTLPVSTGNGLNGHQQNYWSPNKQTTKPV
jgi:hypothetical protein